jgi:hypothetical protein
MANTLQLKNDIKKLKLGLKSKGLSASIKDKLKTQLTKVENELKSAQAGAPPRKVSTTKSTKDALDSLKQLIKKKGYGVYKNAGVDLKKDAQEGALATGRRTSQGLKGNQFKSKSESKGNTYYEYRANRLDVKQPKGKQKYPKLADGGMMNEPTYDSAGFSREDDKRIKIYSGNKGKLKEIFNEFKNQKNELRANEVFDNEKMKGKSVFLFVNDDLYDQYVQDEDEEAYADENFGFADGGMMAKGGNVLKEISTHKAIKDGDKIKIYRKELEFDSNDDIVGEKLELLYSIPSENEDDLLSIFDDFEETNRVLMAEANSEFGMAKGGMMAKGGEVNPKYKNSILKMINYKIDNRIGDSMSKISYTEALNLKNKIQNDESIDKKEIEYIKEMESYLSSKRKLDKVADISYNESFDFVDNIVKMEKGGMMAKGGELPFDNSNLYLNGFGIDSNGNSVVKVSFPNQRAFSIQTNGVLKETNNLYTKNINDLKESEKKTIEKEVVEYVKEFGSKEQKQRLKTYSGYMAKGGNLVGKQKNLDVNHNGKLDAEDFKMLRGEKMAEGGVTEKEVVESNAEMVLSKIKEVHHHADELGDIVSKNSDIEAWVVAKIERASTDLSDITHYLDGQHEKMSMGGSVYHYTHKMDKK